ncbi:hypothetical protein DENSPDRAFT_692196 [Dentipellis sp. KUC8613]|nr:hypothetical protein DENSPDRAFT_692196 [Dentipellis sp. KUC8613]
MLQSLQGQSFRDSYIARFLKTLHEEGSPNSIPFTIVIQHLLDPLLLQRRPSGRTVSPDTHSMCEILNRCLRELQATRHARLGPYVHVSLVSLLNKTRGRPPS